MLEKVKHVHFIGIGGYGMSALALILRELGYRVTGSDLKPSRLTARLQEAGAVIFFKHRAANAAGAELVVFSTAIPADNPEMAYAKEQGIPLWHRSELLAALMNRRYGIAIAGTHGKTTTTAMLSLLLERGGLDPTAVIGGEIPYFNGNARLGKGLYLVAEACESDHSFLRYRPQHAIVTNIEADHLEHYGGDFNLLVQTYRRFLQNVSPEGSAVLCLDDPKLQDILPHLRSRVITYGLHTDADYTAREIEPEGLGSRFTVWYNGAPLGRVCLKVPGIHNVSNSLAAVAVARELGISFDCCREGLAAFSGVKRRFEIIGEQAGVTVVDDYAHHPTEIKATLRAAKNSGKRVLCIFQPHRYTRLSYMMEDFSRSFDDADILLLDDVYPAGEAPIAEVSSSVLANLISQRGHPGVYHVSGKGRLVNAALERVDSGDLVITMGAGDIWQVGVDLLKRLSEKEWDSCGSTPACQKGAVCE